MVLEFKILVFQDVLLDILMVFIRIGACRYIDNSLIIVIECMVLKDGMLVVKRNGF